MASWNDKYGTWGLVAGSAEGLGKAFSEALAKRGMNVALVDIQEDKLYETSRFLEDTYGIRTKRLLYDLSIPENLTFIFESIDGLDCRLMIYNAAYGPVKPFLDHTSEELDRYINLNSRMPLKLAYHFLKNLPENSSGGIVLLSSLAGLFGTNLVAPYGATKAFNYNLAEALYHEFKGKGIDVLGCCAGATDTPNYRNTKPKYGFIRPSVSRPEKIAASTLRQLGKRGFFIPGKANRLTYFFMTALLPRKAASFIMNRTMYRMYAYRLGEK